MVKIEYLIASILLVLIDSIYLNLIKSFFDRQVKKIQGKIISLNLTAAFLAYIFLVFGINYFIIKDKRSVSDAAFLGAVIYFVYEFTNYTIFDDWSFLTVLVDGFWGSILFGSTTYLTYSLMKLVKSSRV
jgi:uncharacterized membrane protein